MAVAESRLIPPGLAESRIRKQSVFGPLLPDRTPGCVARLRVDARCSRDPGEKCGLNCEQKFAALPRRGMPNLTIRSMKDWRRTSQIQKFTLDTNCLIDVEDGRPAAIYVKQILRAALDGIADVAMVASSASERQKDNSFLTRFEYFEHRRKVLGFDHVPIIHPLLRWDIGFWDQGLYASATSEARENLIYRILFPNSPIEWPDYAAQQAVQIEDLNSRAYRRCVTRFSTRKRIGHTISMIEMCL